MTNSQNQELWVTLEDYPNYAVSDHGRINNIKTGKFLGHNTSQGYLTVRLYNNVTKEVKWMLIHRLVGLNFLPNPERKPDINHINGCKTDNRLTNLEWCTPSENRQHAYDTGLQKKPIGESNPNAKLTDKELRYIRMLFDAGCSLKVLACWFKISKSYLRQICNNKKRIDQRALIVYQLTKALIESGIPVKFLNKR